MRKPLLALLGTMLIAGSAMASHLMGGQITVAQSATTSGQYNVTLTLYRDMVGIPINTVQYLHVTDTAAGFDTILTANIISVDTVGGASAVYGVEEYIYTDSLMLPAGNYRIDMSDCCRNAAILNGAANESFYLFTDFTVFASGTVNSTPILLNQPIAFVPLLTPWTYNPLPFDADGDSLVWYIDTPQTGVAPNAGYPIITWTLPTADTSGPFALNNITGEISWTPDSVGNYVASFVVDEYRGGSKIGSIRRDMQFIVSGIPNGSPLLVGLNGYTLDAYGNISVDVYENQAVNIVVTASDNEEDPLLLSCNGETFYLAQNKSTFTAQTQPNASQTGTFTWTPLPQHIRTRPYIIAFRVADLNANISYAIDYTILLNAKSGQGIAENQIAELGNPYPMPAQDRVWVPYTLTQAADANLTITDLAGRTVATHRLGVQAAGQYLNSIPVGDLAAGQYMMSIRANGTVRTVPVSIAR